MPTIRLPDNWPYEPEPDESLDPVVDTVKRNCLSCGEAFEAHGKFNRFCIPCARYNRTTQDRQPARVVQ